MKEQAAVRKAYMSGKDYEASIVYFREIPFIH